MRIRTDYNVGDEVWYKDKCTNEVTSGLINSIVVTIDKESIFLVYCVGIDHSSFKEEELYESKEELLEDSK